MSDQSMSDPQEDPTEGEAAAPSEADPLETNGAVRPPPEGPPDVDNVVVEIDTPSSESIKLIVEYDAGLPCESPLRDEYDVEWREDEPPSRDGIFGPLIIVCND